MSTEQLKAMDQRFYQEVWSQGNLDLLDELLINRTLVYGLLTESLLAVYLVLVFAVQTPTLQLARAQQRLGTRRLHTDRGCPVSAATPPHPAGH